MGRSFKISGIGNAIVDLQTLVTDEDLQRLGIRKGGMTLANREEQERLLIELEQGGMARACGGSGANTIITIAQLGAATTYGCLVGDDVYGVDYLCEMESLGVVTYVSNVPGGRTGTSLILVSPDGERSMVTHLGVSADLASEHLNERVIADSEWIYIEGYLLASPSGRNLVQRAAEIASKSGTQIAVSFSDTFIVEQYRQELRELCERSSLLFANIAEACSFAEDSDREQTFKKLKWLSANWVITLGADGAYLKYDGVEQEVSSFPVSAVDSTGAGDVFAGGFLYAISNGFAPEQSAKLGCFLASRVVTQFGPRLKGDQKNSIIEAGIVRR